MFVSYPPMFAQPSGYISLCKKEAIGIWDAVPTMSGISLARSIKPSLCVEHKTKCLFMARSTSVYMVEVCADLNNNAIIYGPSIGIHKFTRQNCVIISAVSGPVKISPFGDTSCTIRITEWPSIVGSTFGTIDHTRIGATFMRGFANGDFLWVKFSHGQSSQSRENVILETHLVNTSWTCILKEMPDISENNTTPIILLMLKNKAQTIVDDVDPSHVGRKHMSVVTIRIRMMTELLKNGKKRYSFEYFRFTHLDNVKVCCSTGFHLGQDANNVSERFGHTHVLSMFDAHGLLFI